jgi:serine/threonine protein kinase
MSARDPLVLALETEIGAHLAMIRVRPTAPPRIADRYVVGAIVGSGGFGTVVRAHDIELDREVAIKCVPTPEPERAYDLVKAEAQALARVRAPEVVAVYDCVRAHVETLQGRRPCVAIVMEYVPGASLRKWMHDLHERDEKLSVLVSAARGVEAAHSAGLIHRDLKPENVLVTAQNQARIVDFGLAYRLTQTARVTALSRQGRFGLGTPQYMAPEALRGTLTPGADQFSFAVMAWELLTGTLPFASATAGRVLADPRGFVGAERLSRDLLEALGRALRDDVGERFDSIEQLRRTLEGHGGRGHMTTIVTGAAAVAALAATAATAYIAGTKARDRKK